jgi:hypothetical protein
MRLGPARLSFRYEDSFATSSQLEAYERLIHDAMLGDQNLFTRADGVERLWEVAAAVLDDPPPLHPYAPGSWGPDEGTRARPSRPLVLARRPEGGSMTDRALDVARGGDEECPGCSASHAKRDLDNQETCL